jgi:hemerythrin-like domain-containing protein
MNNATGNLKEDHIYILKLTHVMRAVTSSEIPDVERIESIVDIIRNFADGLHHAKEENIFFPALEKKGFSANQGPVAIMPGADKILSDDEQERLGKQFESVEQGRQESEHTNDYINRINELALIYKV